MSLYAIVKILEPVIILLVIFLCQKFGKEGEE